MAHGVLWIGFLALLLENRKATMRRVMRRMSGICGEHMRLRSEKLLGLESQSDDETTIDEYMMDYWDNSYVDFVFVLLLLFGV